MRTRTAVEKPLARASRKSAKELIAEVPGSILFASALADQAGKRKIGSARRKPVRVPAPEHVEQQIQSAMPQLGLLQRVVSWFRARATATTHLRLAETVSLGEKRFVAIIHVEGRKFLIGGGTAGVSLLTQLDETA